MTALPVEEREAYCGQIMPAVRKARG
jgi:hypothetical protein